MLCHKKGKVICITERLRRGLHRFNVKIGNALCNFFARQR